MVQTNHMTISVSGGDTEENSQISSIIYSCLLERGFSAVSINTFDAFEEAKGLSIYDSIRAARPDLFTTPISIHSEREADTFTKESVAIAGVLRQAGGKAFRAF